jgi:hypothetical protein
MALTIGEVRRRNNRSFAFTVQLHDEAKPLEVVCDTKDVARRRIDALKAADTAWQEAVHPLLH